MSLRSVTSSGCDRRRELAADRRQLDLAGADQRRRDHEDDEQHQHHVDVRHDVDLVDRFARRGACRSSSLPLQDVRELLDERLVAHREAVDVVRVAVVADHRGNRGEEADRGGDQRLGDARRDVARAWPGSRWRARGTRS